MDYEKCIPKLIEIKRGFTKNPKPSFNNLPLTYTANIERDSKQGSQAFRSKVEADLSRLMGKSG